MMFYQLKITIRNLRHNVTYSAINICGLAMGIACAMLIFLWVEDELTYNHEFENRDHVYKVMQSMTYAGKTNVFSASPPVLAEVIRGEIPEVTNVTRLTFPERVAMSLDDKQTFETGYYCDPSFFSMFSVQFVNGNPGDAFRDLTSIVLSEKTAEKYFPGENPIGKILQIDRDQVYTVTAVVKEFPENASFQFDWLIPFPVFQGRNPYGDFNWTANSVETIIELEPLADIQVVNKKLVDMLVSHRGSDLIGAFLFNMNSWHLYSDFDDQGQPAGGKVKLIRLFVFIAFVIMILACINFMNLATAGAVKRAKEVGVLKALGAGRKVLIRRFLGESMLRALVSVLLGMIMVVCVLPFFNQLVSKHLSFNFFTPAHLVGAIAIFIFCGLISGAYPAFFLSSFKAVDVLKGLKLPGQKGANGIRKTLVVSQFCVSVCLMICILVMYGQFLHTHERDWGYQKEGVVTIPMNPVMLDHSTALLQEIRNLGTVENAGIAGDLLNSYYKRGDFNWQGKDAGMELPVCIAYNITNALVTMGIELEAGRDFGEDTGLEKDHVVINHRLAQMMGEQGTVGNEIRLREKSYRITGIIKDYIFNDYHAMHSEPLVMFCVRDPYREHFMYVKLRDKNKISQAMQDVETLVEPYIQGMPFEYNVLEDKVNRMMQGDLFAAKLLTGFATIAVLISCFGLLGLIAFAAEQRTKEIGIRKVLGATVSQLVVLLSRDFLKLVGIACIIAFPVAWWVMNQWLSDYEYRIGLHWWIFALAGIIAVVIAWLTVGFQAIKAATANPVKAIKSE